MSGSPGPADPAALRQALAALEGQRGLLGDTVTDLALQPLLAMLAQAEGAATEPQLRRAQVTVLFADIVESTALASRLDAEDVLQVFGTVLQRAAACVRARGGRVLRYTGDGLKAGFGTQGTREDDAARAVLAGLDILAAGREHAAWVAREHGVHGFALRVGAHTGEVALGAGFEADNTLTGDTVNLAARLEQAAPPGGLRVSAETWAHVRGRFEAEAQPPLVLKGVEQPMSTWLVKAARAGVVERGIEGLAVPMIGRSAEQAQLLAALKPEPGRGLRAITLVADGGIGKTRLLRETLQAAPGLRVLVVRAQPGAELRPWGLLHGLFSAHCGISDGDSAEQARERLVRGLAAELAEDAEAQAQRIGQLLGMDFGDVPALRSLDARALRDLAFAALLDWLAGLVRTSDGASVVLVFEDLHWADEASLDALTHWIEHAATLPLTLLMSTRPALLERRPAWCSEAPVCQRLTLDALSEADRPALADALMQRIESPPLRLRDLIVNRAEGNPFYMEELLRRLLDDGAIRREGAQWRVDDDRLDRLRLPTTLVGLLQARLDALPPAERLGAQRASIVGHVFWDAALAQIDPAAPEAMQTLQRRQWVRQRAASAFEGTAERQFDHHLLHQVTYDTVLKEDRRQGHAAVARWLAQRTEGRAPEFVAITAEHAERAGDAALALEGYERAATEAQRRFANALAIDCLRKAVKLVPEDKPHTLFALLNRLYELLDLVVDRDGQAEVLERQQAVLASHPDPQTQAALLMNRAMLADRQGELDRAFELANEALLRAQALDDRGLTVYARLELCWINRTWGRLEAATVQLEAARAMAAQLQDSDRLREIQVLQLSGILAASESRYWDSVHDLEKAVDLAESAGHGRALAGSLSHLLSSYLDLGLHDAGLRTADRMIELTRKVGDRRGQDSALRQRANVWIELGEYERARVDLQALMDRLRGSREWHGTAMTAGTLGLALQHLGDARGARQAYEESRQLWELQEPGSLNAVDDVAWIATQDLALGDPGAARNGLEAVMVATDNGARLAGTACEVSTRLAVWRLLHGLQDEREQHWLAASQARVLELAAGMARTPSEVEAVIRRIALFRALMTEPPTAPQTA